MNEEKMHLITNKGDFMLVCRGLEGEMSCDISFKDKKIGNIGFNPDEKMIIVNTDFRIEKGWI